MTRADLAMLAPELGLALLAMLMFAVRFLRRDRQLSEVSFLVAAVAMVLAAFLIIAGPETESSGFGGSVVIDPLVLGFKPLLLITMAVLLIIGRPYLRRFDLLQPEFPALSLAATVGMLLLVSAADLITLIAASELMALPLYVLATYRRDSPRTVEAGLKFLLVGIVSSGVTLLGAAILFADTGALNLAAIGSVESVSLYHVLGFALLFMGLGAKLCLVPFHIWVPDVFEGTPTPVTAFLATGPILAVATALARLVESHSAHIEVLQTVVVSIALVSIVVGALGAMGQTNIKRFFAYVLTATLGFALLGLAAGTEEGTTAFLFSMLLCCLSMIAVFSFILTMERDDRPVTDLKSLGQYSSLHPGRAMAMALLLFSLVGAPPFLGFFGVVMVVQSAVTAGLVMSSALAILLWSVVAFNGLRIVHLMYFGDAGRALSNEISFLPSLVLTLVAAFFLLGSAPFASSLGLEELARRAAEGMGGRP